MTPTQGEHAQTALEDFEVRKLAAIGAVSTSSGLVERRPIEYRRELENQFVRGYRAAESRLHAQVAALTAQPAAPQGVAYAELEKKHRDFVETVSLMLDAIGYKEDYARQWPKEKASITFKRWFDEQRASHGQAPAGAAIHPQIQATLAKLDVPVRGYLASHSGTLHHTADKVDGMESAVPLVSQHDHRNACETIIKLLSVKDAS